jgi:Mrp family chromosome partitioning ATPase
VQLRALERDAKSQRDLLESYLAKYREATARDSIDATSPDARIISTATVSNTPSWPKTLPTILVAALGMLALTVGFTLTSELLAAMPGAAFAPRVSGPAPAAGGGGRTREPAQGAAEAQAAIGVPLESIEALGQEIAGHTGSRVVIVGAARNVGTTVTAITLARSLARTRSVVLVDLALAGPNLSVIAADPLAPGMAELIAGTASYGDIITRDRHSGLHLVMAGRVAGDPQALIAAPRLAVAIEALAQSYEHLVIDAGALPEMAAERFAALAHHAVLIASEVDDLATLEAREKLLRAGFADVEMLASGGDQRAEAGRAAA